MRSTNQPIQTELMVRAHRALRERLSRQAAPAPEAIVAKPSDAAPRPKTTERARRSLRCCHRPSLTERARHSSPKETGAYVPETSAVVENDRNLTDGARRCARKLMEETYRRNREGRTLAITVSYLASALGKCRRTVQRYLRQLEEEGYIDVDVACGQRSRLCVGLVVRLLGPLFPRHHQKNWPVGAAKPGATAESQNHRFSTLVSRQSWAIKCMDGVFRAFMKTRPLDDLPSLVSA